MGNKEKLSECLGWLAVALAQYVGEYGLPYTYRVEHDSGVILFQMNDYERVRSAARCFAIEYILSLEDPIECLRMELIDMHKELSGGEVDGDNI